MNNRVDREKKFWQFYAKRYDSFIKQNAARTYAIILEKLKKDTTGRNNLLEVATGTGIWAIALSNQIKTITAIDIAPAMIEVAKAKAFQQSVTNIDFQVGDSCQLDFQNKTFDVVIASNLLHLLFEPAKALAEMNRVLKDDGILIVPTYCHGQNLKTQLLSRLITLSGFRVPNRWNTANFQKFVCSNGFSTLKSEIIKDKMPLVYLVAKKK